MDIFPVALRWHNQGLSCLPCYPNSKAILKGFSPKRTKPELPDLLHWFSNTRNNICLVTGQADDSRYLVVIDFDSIVDYYEWKNNYQLDTYTVESRRGFHCYFWTAERPESHLVCEYAEIKASGACVMIPPSKVGEFEYRIFEDKPIMRIERIQDVIQCSVPPSKRENPPSISVTVKGNNNIVTVNTFPFTRCQNPIQTIKASLPISYLFPDYISTDNGMALAHCPTSAHPNGDIHPSLSLDLSSNRFNCFKTNCPLHLPRGGDILDAYAILNGLTLKQTIAELAEMLGL